MKLPAAPAPPKKTSVQHSCAGMSAAQFETHLVQLMNSRKRYRHQRGRLENEFRRRYQLGPEFDIDAILDTISASEPGSFRAKVHQAIKAVACANS